MTLALYLLFLLSGCAGLIYESVWTRYLGLFVGHDAYAQIIVLVIFLGGMSLGAAAVSRLSGRWAQPLVMTATETTRWGQMLTRDSIIRLSQRGR